MAFRADIHVEWSRSPRIVVVEAPSVELTMQDLVDTLRTLEAELDALDDVDPLLNATGKEDLGGGATVGITVQLINAKIAFEARTTAASTGTATSNNAGELLTDSTATFLSDGLEVGDTVINFSDQAIATILSVTNTTIGHYPLAGGTSDDWIIGDTYRIMHNHQCTCSGGNLTAVDDAGDPMNPISPTFGTHVQIAQSSSATAIGVDTSGIADAVWESTAATPGTHGEDLIVALATIQQALALAKLIPALV